MSGDIAVEYQKLDPGLESEGSEVNSTSNLLNCRDEESIDSEQGQLVRQDQSHHGRHLGVFSTMILFISRILGSGIFAASSGIFASVGRSPFFFFLAWLVSFALAFSGLYVYLELGSLIHRSGGTKTFLEVIYDKPFMLVNTVFALYSILFGFAIASSLVFGEYFLRVFDIEPTTFRSKAVGLAFVYMAGALHTVSLSHGVFVQNIMGGLKIMLLFCMLLTCLWVTCFPSNVTGIESHLHWDTFFDAKSELTVSGFANAVMMASFTLAGWNLGHTSSSEVKDPVRTFKIAGPLSLLLVVIGYISINICYLVVIPADQLAESGSLLGSYLFEAVFGKQIGRRFLTLSIALSTAGNIFVVIYGVSRVSQEVFRDGYLPFSRTMASSKPYGTPLPTIALCVALTTLIMICTPSGNVYNYIILLEGYPVQLATVFVGVGLFVLRKKHPETRAPIRATRLGTILVILLSSYLCIAPLLGRNANPEGCEDWISYPVAALLVLTSCFIYWLVYFQIIPKYKGYSLVPENIQLEDGSRFQTWNKTPGRL